MLIKTFASAVHGIDATTITIETEISQGIKFYMVGLPDSAVKESQQRIESAMRLNNFKDLILSRKCRMQLASIKF